MNNIANTKPSTVRQFIAWTIAKLEQVDLFYGHGTDNPQDEAVYLIFGILEMPFDVHEDELDQLLSAEQCQQIEDIIEKRINSRQPTAYLLGEAWFCGLSFYVNENVLVPRSPFAELIREYFQPWLQQEPSRILDIGTGSGCIAIACALAFPEARVDAADISEQALEVAARNVRRHNLSDRMRLFKSDLFSGIENESYDLIVSNPPYVSAEDIAALPAEYHHEPVLGLEGGGDGLDIVRQLLLQAKDYLSADGLLVVEVGLMQETLSESMPELAFTWLDFAQGGSGVFVLNRIDLEGLS